jgi:secreted trypsin-like serine protease
VKLDNSGNILPQLIESDPIELDGVHAAAIRLLPQDTPVVAGTPTQVSGWGATQFSGFNSEVLLKADVPVIDYDECQKLHQGELHPNEICAGPQDNSMDSCLDDDGGALVYNGTLIGIATFANSCGSDGVPGVYTNAAKYTNWIKLYSGVTPPK